MNKRSKVAVFNGPDMGFSLEEFIIPELKGDEVLVKIKSCTICGSDIHTYTGRRPGPAPGALGHEITGLIVDFGPESKRKDFSGKDLSEGDIITWLLYSYDENEEISKKGIPQKSSKLFKYGHEAITKDDALHSGFAEYMIIRSGTTIHKLNGSIPASSYATLNCGLATSMGAIRISEVTVNDSVAVIGCGLLGLYTISILHSLGVKNIAAIDIDDSRLNLSEKFGADKTLHFSEFNNQKYDLIFEISGVAEAMEKSVKSLSIGGRLVLVGGTFEQPPIEVSGEKIIRNLLTIKGLHNYIPKDLQSAVDFLENQYPNYPFQSLIEKSFSLADIDEAFEYARTNRPVRVAVVPDE